MDQETTIAAIAQICSQDVGRGITKLWTATKDDLSQAALALTSNHGAKVGIITGFYIPHGNPSAPETDGLIGAAHLAQGLTAFGLDVTVLTDTWCHNALAMACELTGFGRDKVLGDQDLDRFTPNSFTHLIAIERAGSGVDGVVRNMGARDISAYTTPKLEQFYRNSQGIKIAIGDGGNELGMGKLPRSLIAQEIKHGDQIACVVPCDYLIVCGVSHWGAYGLLGAIAALKPQKQAQLMASLDRDEEILQALVNSKLAVDGVTGKAEPSIDGLPWPAHQQILSQIQTCLNRVQGVSSRDHQS
jgi:hypothetical protein